jgi:DNA (cytosine-5)-methyltransferase 1
VNDVKTVELFAGIGGFRLGLERANPCNSRLENGKTLLLNTDDKPMPKFVSQDGNRRQQCASNFKIVWANEWDKYACQIYRKNFGEKELCEGDVRKIDTNDIPDVDLIVGGFPCQPHSLAGKRKGFSDERGEVFYEIIRIAQAKRPKMLLLENVKGLLSSEQGRAFGTVLEELGNIGYWCEWQVINSKHHGVPQNRERLFIIGHLRGTSSRQIFPIIEGNGIFTTQSSGECGEGQGLRGCISPTIDAIYGALRNAGEPYIIQVKRTRADGNHMIREYKGQVPTLTRQMGTGGGNVPMVIADRTRSYAGKGRNFESPKPYANTLSGVQKDNLVLLDNLGGNIKEGRVKPLENNVAWTLGGSKTGISQQQRIRRLTPTECERLQGFPDGWTEGVSDTQRYKCLGNAVTVNVIQAIGEHILEASVG